MNQRALGLIRLSLAVSVLLFGVVSWTLHQQPGWTAQTSQPMALRYAQVALSVVAVIMALAMRRPVAVESDPARRQSMLIRAWAVGEAPALFGGVIFFLTGEALWYGIGLAAMFASFLTLPIRRVTDR